MIRLKYHLTQSNMLQKEERIENQRTELQINKDRLRYSKATDKEI